MMTNHPDCTNFIRGVCPAGLLAEGVCDVDELGVGINSYAVAFDGAPPA